MSAAITDKFTHVGLPGTITSLQSPGKAIGATSISIGSPTNWDTVTAVYFAIRVVDPTLVTTVNPSGIKPGTYTEWKGTLSGTTISNLSLQYGSDQVYPAGANTQVYIGISAPQMNSLVDGILVQHNQDGSHKTVTTDTLTVSSAITLPTSSVAFTALPVGSAVRRGLNVKTTTGTLLTTTYTTYCTVTAATIGNEVELSFIANLTDAGSGNARVANIRIQCDGTTISGSENTNIKVAVNGNAAYGLTISHTPTTGNHTWTLQVLATTASATSLDQASLRVTELK